MPGELYVNRRNPRVEKHLDRPGCIVADQSIQGSYSTAGRLSVPTTTVHNMVNRVPYTGGEKESLRAALDRHRDVVLWKVEGLDDEQLRRPMTPSGTNLLGLVKHLGGAELGWFCATFGRDTGPLPFDLNVDPTSDMRAEPHESTDDILEFYRRARAAADKTIGELDLDGVGTAFAFFDGATVSLRWAMIHVLEETVRHSGQMDILRELSDGATGDHNWG